jgi:2-hydroxychromene-2-carboxylate isomerase
MSGVPASRPVVDFFFDCSCPWSYLALGRLREAAIRTGTLIRYRPLLVDDLLQSANPGAARDGTEPLSARARYQAKDLQDWARFCGLRIRRPSPWPVRTEWAARGVVAARDQGGEFPYLEAAYAALFGDGRAVTDWAIVEDVARAVGLDPARFETVARSSAAAEEICGNAAELEARGGFGTPSMLIGDDLYFGNDRMPLAEAAMARQAGMRLVLPGEHG